MNYNVGQDLRMIREMLGLSMEKMASLLGLTRLTVYRIETEESYPSEGTINKIYNFAYKRNIKLNAIKEMFYKEEITDKKLLFHGAKSIIEGDVSPYYGKKRNDFGQGFYCGESSEQAISFVNRYPDSSMYILSFDDKDLKMSKFEVNQEWMLAVAYYRGTLDKYKDHPLIRKIIRKVEGADYLYAPIADNRMFKIIDDFIDGLITDEQCKHCLAATNLGNQYVFLNEKATKRLTILERCFISELERNHYQNIKEAELNDGDSKVKLALIKYKREGKYIEEILG